MVENENNQQECSQTPVKSQIVRVSVRFPELMFKITRFVNLRKKNFRRISH